MNPYASPRSAGHAPAPEPRRSPWRFFIYSFFFYPVWFIVGGAFSIGGSPAEMAVDAGLLAGVVGATIVTFFMGVFGELRLGTPMKRIWSRRRGTA